MYVTIDGNFGFLADIDKDLYSKAHEMESIARTNFARSGQLCRQVMEKMATEAINRLGVANKILTSKKLNNDNLPMCKMALGRKYKVLANKDLLQSMDSAIEKATFPALKDVTYSLANGKKRTSGGYEFLRMLGNTGSHASGNPEDIEINYQAILTGIQFAYNVACAMYKKDDEPVRPFDESRMPILNYHILSGYTPDDSARSKCIKEFTAELREGDGKKKRYAILRMYDKKAAVKQAFMIRNQTSFSEASSVSIDSVPEGMTLLRELTPINSPSTNFYIIAYIFNKEPFPLAKKLFEIKDLNTKMRMCARLARCVENLHNSEIPICCRLLNFESVYVSEFREWVPYIIKFDYSKISDKSAPAATVYKNAKSASEDAKTQRKLAKYIPYEWDQLDQSADIDAWKKVDVYSLGILMADILEGKISDQPADLENLLQKGVPEETLEMIDLMISEDPCCRPDIDEVEKYFKERM